MDAVTQDAGRRTRRPVVIDLGSDQVIIDRGAAARYFSPSDLPDRVHPYLRLVGLKQHLLTADGGPAEAFSALARGELPEHRSAPELQRQRWREAIAVELAHHAANKVLGPGAAPAAHAEAVEKHLPEMRARVEGMTQQNIERCCAMRPFQARYSQLYGIRVNNQQLDALLDSLTP